jgi:hypothetical protein
MESDCMGIGVAQDTRMELRKMVQPIRGKFRVDVKRMNLFIGGDSLRF